MAKTSRISRVSRRRAYKTGQRVGNLRYVASANLMRGISRRNKANLALAGVSRLESMIETKEGTRRIVNTQCPHNNVLLLSINPFELPNGVADEMVQNSGQRIGDRITVRGLMVKAFLENSLGRSKVYWRIILLRAPKGDGFNRADVFRNSSSNKMIDQVNTERYTIIKQKIFNIQSTQAAPTGVGANGVPTSTGLSGIATRTLSMWIPGTKFGRNGNVQYENQSQQVKFYDYRFVVLCYDWYGTPQDVNNVGFINEFYTKLYFKDA